MIEEYGNGITVRPSEKEDALAIAKNMREADVKEVWAAGHLTAEEAMLLSYRTSTLCWTVEKDGEPIIMFGSSAVSPLCQDAYIWLLATPEFEKIGFRVAKYSTEYINRILSIHNHVYNYVHCDNKVSVRWLKWCGAIFDEPAPYGYENDLFQRFYITKEGE